MATFKIMTYCKFRYNGSKCEHPQYKNGEYCVFHCEDIELKRSDFESCIKGLLSESNLEGTSSCDMRGFVFPSFQLKQREIGVNLEFQSAHFRGTTDFDGSRFEGEIDFSECTFHSNASFNNCVFIKDTSFRKSQFEDKSGFRSSIFHSEASYSNVRFSGAANFYDCEFMEKASFRKSSFINTTDFRQVISRKEIDFKECVFERECSFKDAHFDRFISLRECKFINNVTFSRAEFSGELSAEFSKFKSRVIGDDVNFIGKVDFSNSTFEAESEFSRCKFKQDLKFDKSHFHWQTIFDASTFSGRASFHKVNFSGITLFRECEFSNPVEFEGAEFHNEIDFSRSKFRFIKNVDSEKKVIFDHTVIEDAHFWGIDVLDSYSFKSTYLLSLNLSNKTLHNCDFTGAVVSGVNTKNWNPDARTIAKTKYIYTNYNKETIVENNLEKVVYSIDEDSIVPAEGHFGQGEHENYTIADYLKSLCVWSLSLNVPQEIRKPFLDYINFFSEYMRAAEMIDVELRTRREGRKLRVEFVTDDELSKKAVQQTFPTYIDNMRNDSGLLINFRNPEISSNEKEQLSNEYARELSLLRERLDSKEKLLKNEEEKNSLLLEYMGNLKDSPSEITKLAKEKSSEAIFIISMDVTDYSKSTTENPELSPEILSHLNTRAEGILQSDGIPKVQFTGDGLLVFCYDGLEAMILADDLLRDFRKFNISMGSTLKGVRLVIGYGLAHKEKSAERVDYSGSSIVKTCRVDQVMKNYLLGKEGSSIYNIWCLSSYFEEMKSSSDKIQFTELGKFKLDKNFGEDVLYEARFK